MSYAPAKRFIQSLLILIAVVAGLYPQNIHSSQLHRISGNTNRLYFDTIHGPLLVTDPLAIELIKSPAMQRLKNIYQYGVNEFIFPKKKYHYSRFHHCLGVYQILKDRNVSRQEQIAGLLHDASHTVFSHTMDVFFMGGMNKGGYQDTIHEHFLKTYGVEKILAQHGMTVGEILPDQPNFRCLEQPHPGLCADRIEYILHAGDLEELMTSKDIHATHNDLQFDGENWYFKTPDIAEKFGFISLNQTLNTWGSPDNILVAQWITQAIKILWEQNDITSDDVHFNLRDELLWDKLVRATNPIVQELIQKALTVDDHYDLENPDEQLLEDYLTLHGKFRGVDPLVHIDGKLTPLTQISKKYKQDYDAVREQMKLGWKIRLTTEER